MLQNDDTTLVDGLSTPYNNSHCLYINTFGTSFHNATVGANPNLPALWHYMLTSSTAVSIQDAAAENITLFPNPTNGMFTIVKPKVLFAKKYKY